MKKIRILQVALVVAFFFSIYQTLNYFSLKSELEALKKKTKEPPYSTTITYIAETGNF